MEEFTPFCAAASSNGAFAPHRLDFSERFFHHFVTWIENKVQADDAHDTGTTDTEMDHVVSRARRSRLGAALTLVSCNSLASVHSYKPAYMLRVSAACSTPLLVLFFWLKVCKHRLASVLPTLTVLAGSTTSFSIGVVGNCLIGLLIGFG